MAEFDANVIIVGLGPCGNYLAHLLSSYGVDNIIAFEKSGKPYFAPRAVVWDDYTLRSATSAGGPDLNAYMRWHAGVLGDLCHAHGHVSGIRCGPPDARRCLPSPHGALGVRSAAAKMMSQPYSMASFHQPTWEAELRQRLSSRTGVAAHYGSEVLEVLPMHGSCLVRVAPAGTSETRAFKARYCVVTDGASSNIRKQLGLDCSASSVSDQPWIIVDSEVHDEEYLRTSWIGREGNGIVANRHHPFVFVRTPAFFADWWTEANNRPTGRFAAVEKHAMAWKEIVLNQELATYLGASENASQIPAGVGCRFEFPLDPATAVGTATSDAYIDKFLRSTCGVDPDHMRIIQKSIYTYHSHVASKWRIGPVILAGDAAHSSPPFQGQGLNLGVGDVVNVAWKLALLLQGKASDSILDTYEPERRAHLEQVAQDSVDLSKFASSRNDAEVLSDSTISASPGIRANSAFLPLLEGQPLAGTLFPCPSVQSDGHDMLLDELLAPNGFSLVCCGRQTTSYISVDARALLSRISAKVVLVAPSQGSTDLCSDIDSVSMVKGLWSVTCCDVEGHWTHWVDDQGIGGCILVVRPDKYIFGVFQEFESAKDSLDKAFRGASSPCARL